MSTVILFLSPAVVFFALQFWLCRKTENRLIRLIPVGLLLAIVVAEVVLFAIGTQEVGHAWHGFLGLLGMSVFASALIGDVLAWIINSGW